MSDRTHLMDRFWNRDEGVIHDLCDEIERLRDAYTYTLLQLSTAQDELAGVDHTEDGTW